MYETYDSYLKLFWPDTEGEFYNVENFEQSQFNRKYSEHVTGFTDSLFKFTLSLSTASIENSREIYSLLDLLGDLGGVTDVLIFIIGIFIFPISQHSFTMRYLQKMFLVRTSQSNLF
jgi:hypothetical protein